MTEIETEILSEKIPFGLHVCLLYDDDKIRYDMLADFIKTGLVENQKILYLYDGDNPDNFYTNLEKRGIILPNNNIIASNTKDGYTPNGKFIKEDMNKKTITFAEESIKEGYIGSRGSGEMSWTLKFMKDAIDLMVYEANLTEVIKNTKYIAICQYDTRLFSGQTIMDALKTHPIIAINGKLIKNPYYIEPELFIKQMNPHPL